MGCWCIYKDIIGLISLPIGYIQILFVNVCTIYFTILPEYGYSLKSVVLICVMLFFSAMVVWCGLKASFTDPGMVDHSEEISKEQLEYIKMEEKHNYCEKCDKMKPFRAHHCSKCGICVLKMDHHCPWINNCVGARNQKYFMLYLVYVFLGEMYAVLLGGNYIYLHLNRILNYIEFVYLGELYPINQYMSSWINDHILVPYIDSEIFSEAILMMEVFFSLVFAIFVVILFIDQIRSIRYDMTYVEYLKQYHYHTLENCFGDCLVSCMGEPFCWRWFLPIEGKNLRTVIKKLSAETISVNPYSSSSEDESEEEPSLEQKKNQLLVYYNKYANLIDPLQYP